jgi:hypothetical protein
MPSDLLERADENCPQRSKRGMVTPTPKPLFRLGRAQALLNKKHLAIRLENTARGVEALCELFDDTWRRR